MGKIKDIIIVIFLIGLCVLLFIVLPTYMSEEKNAEYQKACVNEGFLDFERISSMDSCIDEDGTYHIGEINCEIGFKVKNCVFTKINII